MTEPLEIVVIKTLIAEQFPVNPYPDTAFSVTALAAKPTSLEKTFLLHETFHQTVVPPRVEHMSQHLYDLEKMKNTHVGTEALALCRIDSMIIRT